MRQIVRIYEAYGVQRPAEGINKFLEDNPDMEIKPGAVVPVPISFAGGEMGGGVLVVFSRREDA